MPCVYLPGPAPAVTVANSFIEVDKQYFCLFIGTEYSGLGSITYRLFYIHFILMYCLVCVGIGVTSMSGYKCTLW